MKLYWLLKGIVQLNLNVESFVIASESYVLSDCCGQSEALIYTQDMMCGSYYLLT